MHLNLIVNFVILCVHWIVEKFKFLILASWYRVCNCSLQNEQTGSKEIHFQSLRTERRGLYIHAYQLHLNKFDSV